MPLALFEFQNPAPNRIPHFTEPLKFFLIRRALSCRIGMRPVERFLAFDTIVGQTSSAQRVIT